MGFSSSADVVDKPWSSASTVASDWTLQQLAPYIGRMKTAIARYLIERYSQPGEIVADPFCGSGVVPFEAAALGRQVCAGDVNPYGITLTRAKLHAPSTSEEAFSRFNETWRMAKELQKSEALAPDWVKEFFHASTLAEAIALRDACMRLDDVFSMACLLGILHHQRPGFLSYPSSHLVPYLRNRKYPRELYPELYKYRDVYSRMIKKIRRTYRRVPCGLPYSCNVHEVDACAFPGSLPVDAVITSPPYMNLLDYGRDNRLRLWFLNGLAEFHDFPRGKREASFSKLMFSFLSHWSPRVRAGGSIVLVLGDVSRGGKSLHPAEIVKKMVKDYTKFADLSLEYEVQDAIPDIRRSRREVKGGKEEVIIAFRKGP